MAATSLAAKCGFVSIETSIFVESSLEGTVYKVNVEPPHQVAPVVQHGEPVNGIVTLTAPPGDVLLFGGLVVRIHVAKLNKHGGATKQSKEQQEALKSMPKFMQPKDPPITRAFDAPSHVTADVVVLEPGQYRVDGEIRVPFSISTAELPRLESFQAADNSEICHWVEAHVATVGWRGKLAYVRE
eukprot:5966181-Prymnesium_polylepis.1